MTDIGTKAIEPDFQMFLSEISAAVSNNRHDEIDRLCLRWLKLACTEHGETGAIASALLDQVRNVLRS